MFMYINIAKPRVKYEKNLRGTNLTQEEAAQAKKIFILKNRLYK
jgi:hypothetical protein